MRTEKSMGLGWIADPLALSRGGTKRLACPKWVQKRKSLSTNRMSGNSKRLADVRFSNRPFGVKHFQAIRLCGVGVAHGLVLLFGIGTKALPVWDYRGGWCPFCNLELKAYQDALPRITAAGASLVAISPEKPDNSMSTAEKNALTFPVLSDVGQKVGKAFGVVYAFTDELRAVYDGFKLHIPETNGTPGEWSLPLSATYVIGSDGRILFADTSVDYRHRTDPLDVLQVLERRVAAE